ncbi:hypothetical protein COCC4DRAFT_41208 [Bipolaris maydis ATCC 48331]|uniref:G-protein coupled receptors family 3 profile domain-containing protein n=2 Tax=Cochliobolus heterostrophus TaxID=5016 RepID=M2UF13_COCH5|nr:uncharacterized protein COCC4DRAFT_41208 [Bipolaris maydis ATCC 48331]EMD97109.1 hypothetical protein COCHEDRAFT_1018741 [Bipolaris maydis C5]KAH7551515.1 hypothetical protein BM1_09831 [Bipolaris maydis]ENI04427.1 hypothetical protein COCC4DRAFT_41208 [Bipolaris maydis ATCC 48331]KAJ5029567.1 hypothetical protein J3E73DRAFT_286561 [Bipolaris maydis]KAJ5061688.1 hypothetical protein J3E74DRAFT_329412 [Bipolaris maydis]
MAPTNSSPNLSKRSFCGDALSFYITKINFSYYITFIIIFVAIFIASLFVRKRISGPGKSLIGFAYILTLLLAITCLVIDFAALLRSLCGTGGFPESRDMAIASNTLGFISVWGMLFLVVYQVNILLRKQLGSAVMMFRIICVAMVGVIGALYIASLSISSYLWWETPNMWRDDQWSLQLSSQRLSLAVRALYLLCVIVSAALSTMTLSGLRRAQLAAGDLIGWVAALHIFMFIWSGLSVVLQALSLYLRDFDPKTSIALSYVLIVFQALSFVALLGIAKHSCWKQGRKPAQHVYAPAMQGHTAYVH